MCHCHGIAFILGNISLSDLYLLLLWSAPITLLCSGTLQSAQVANNDLLMLAPRQAPQQPQQQAPQQPQQQHLGRNRDGSLQNPQAFLDALLSNPAGLNQLPPQLRDAVNSGDVEAIQGVFRQLQRQAEAQQMEDQLIRPGEDPMDPAVQV